MSYKVGDTVKIKSEEALLELLAKAECNPDGEYFDFVGSMLEYAGMSVEIVGARTLCNGITVYDLSIGDGYQWYDTMLEPAL